MKVRCRCHTEVRVVASAAMGVAANPPTPPVEMTDAALDMFHIEYPDVPF